MRPKEAIVRVELLSDLPEKAVDELVQRGAGFSFKAGRVIVEQGSKDSGLQLVLEGSASVHVNDVPRGTVSEGDYFGEMSLIDGAPRSATVVAGPDGTKTFTVSPLVFSELLDEYPGIARSLLGTLTARVRSLEASLES
jgi:CRP-like cAMP-binding protein